MLSWRPELAAAASDLAPRLAAVEAEALDAALDREIRSQADAFLRGLEAYRHHPYRRSLTDPPVLWQEGTTRLLDFGPRDGAPVFVVPSLVNRAYILDLAPGRSFMRYLGERGLRPLLVDWSGPGEAERGFTLTDYIAGRLEAAWDAAIAAAGAPMALMGYCMGGLLALGLAHRRRRETASLVLLATPWDFHAEAAAQARLLGSLAEPLGGAFALLGEIPVDVLQSLFFALDPLLALRKFSRFAALPEGGTKAEEFVAVEDWLNDGVSLALPTAREVFAGWYGENLPGRSAWRVAGRIVDPAALEMPALVVVPGQDRIVPPATARALGAGLKRARLMTPPLGHIGMMIGSQAEEAVWRPVADWIRQASEPAGWTRPEPASMTRLKEPSPTEEDP